MAGNNGLEILSYSTSPGTKWVENCCKPESGIPLWVMWAATCLWAEKWAPPLSHNPEWAWQGEYLCYPGSPSGSFPQCSSHTDSPGVISYCKAFAVASLCLPEAQNSSYVIIPTTVTSVLCTEIVAMILMTLRCHTKIKETFPTKTNKFSSIRRP